MGLQKIKEAGLSCFFDFCPKTTRLRTSCGESDAGAMCREYAAPRGGAQPEERDGATRGEGDLSLGLPITKETE
ncbi:MAG: hypothetical protein V1656_02485 [Candidatus Jorgensenbacteria bacterium]